MKYPRGRILVFAKTPQPGKVKTRLAADIGAGAACDLYCSMLAYTVRTVTRAGIAAVALYVYPEDDSPYFQALSSRYPVTLYRQDGRDLGERMANAIEAQLEEADFVILMGTDCLLIDALYLEQAAARLAGGAAVVFGPADDGGYVLVGMRQPHRELFAEISWGSDKVMAQSRRQGERLGLPIEELPSLFDIDTVTDWQRLQREYPHIVNQLNQQHGKPDNESRHFG